jgi:hypothetical protein
MVPGNSSRRTMVTAPTGPLTWVGMAGFEPAASCSQSRRANQAALHPGQATRSLPCRGRSMLSHISRGKTLTTSLASPIPCYQRRLVLAPPTHRHQAGTLPVATKPSRGRSSMAEPQPSKLVMRVRFPSPAPTNRVSAGQPTILRPDGDHLRRGLQPGGPQTGHRPDLRCPRQPGRQARIAPGASARQGPSRWPHHGPWWHAGRSSRPACSRAPAGPSVP